MTKRFLKYRIPSEEFAATFLGKAFAGRLPQNRSLSVELCGLYWHFVDVVWIVIFTLVYLLEGVKGA